MPQSIETLFEGVELSKEVKDQIQESFESAVNEKAKTMADEIVADRLELIEAENKAKVDEAISEAKTELESATEKYINEEVIPDIQSKADKFLTYVAKEWMNENQLQVENGLKVELAESVITTNRDLLKQFDFTVESDDKLVEAQTALEEKSAKLDESLGKIAELQESVEKLNRKASIASVKAQLDLTESQVEKLSTLSEELSFKDSDSFTAKVKDLAESHFAATPRNPVVVDDKEKIDESANKPKSQRDEYLSFLGEAFKK